MLEQLLWNNRMRKLATIRTIDKIEPIPGADKIVKATVGGWQLVTAIDNGFSAGDAVIYLEIDSWVPTEIASFLSKGKEPRVFNGVKGERLRTVKLRGQISQGLLLPLSVLPESSGILVIGNDVPRESLDVDVSEILNIQKWEPPINPQLAGIQRGTFPSFIPKTDQERIQNLKGELEYWVGSPLTWEETEKLEGSSMTVYLNIPSETPEDDFGVCSRNMDLVRDANNTFWKVAIRDNLEEKMRGYTDGFALQGELIGPGVQGNIYGLTEHRFMVFDIYDIKAGKYVLPRARREICTNLGIDHVPVLGTAVSLNGETMESMIRRADGASVMGDIKGPRREGLVYKCNEVDPSFKVISNEYLMGEKE